MIVGERLPLVPFGRHLARGGVVEDAAHRREAGESLPPAVRRELFVEPTPRLGPISPHRPDGYPGSLRDLLLREPAEEPVFHHPTQSGVQRRQTFYSQSSTVLLYATASATAPRH